MSEPKNNLLFSITAQDFDFQYYRGTGNGGQKKQKTSSACRCIHRASGAVGQSQDDRSQMRNKTIAFKRCIETKEFQNWHRLEIGARMRGFVDAERMVDEQMQEKYLKIETYDPEMDI